VSNIDYVGLAKVAILDAFALFITFTEIERGLKVTLIIITIFYTIIKAINEAKKLFNKNNKYTDEI